MKTKTVIKKELEEDIKIYHSISLLRDWEGIEDEHGEEIDFLNKYLKSKKSDFDDNHVLSQIFAYQWVLDIPIKIPKLMTKDVDKFIKQLASEFIVDHNIILM